jgi:transcriptional regulator with XRE-family HTH domain
MRLRQLRESRLLSQRELAARAGVSLRTIVAIEAGRRRPHPATLRKLAEALAVPADVLAAYLADGGWRQVQRLAETGTPAARALGARLLTARSGGDAQALAAIAAALLELRARGEAGPVLTDWDQLPIGRLLRQLAAGEGTD